MRGLAGKRVLIAGGATGIGAATAERLAAEGAAVVIGDVNLDGALDTAKRIDDAGGFAFAVEFDLTDEDSVAELVNRAVAELDGIDGLFNVGADMSQPTLGSDTDLLDMDVEVWRRTYEVNLLGYALTCRSEIPVLLSQGGGANVNTSSGAAFGGEPTRPAYAISKAGVNALTRHIASRWGKDGIRCNGVAPGLVLSEQVRQADDQQLQKFALRMTRSPRLGEPTDLAAVVAFLFSDDAAWINGQVWTIDGGMNLRD